MEFPLVSVCIITYQHVNYIKECLDGVLMQETLFPFEIIIGEDESTDGTREVCQKYAEKYPGKIFLFLRSRKDVIYVNGSPNGRYNFIECIKSAKGKYIAICEGDDYWTDPYKLQKQVDFLETHHKYVGCFHNTEERFEDDDNKASFLYCSFPSARDISFIDLSDVNLIPTCSVMFRNRLFGEFPNWYSKLSMGDWPLHLLNAQFGNFWYMPKVMGVHRLHEKGIWMMQDADKNNLYVNEAYSVMIKYFDNRLGQVNYLVEAQKRFIRDLNAGGKKVGYKERFKNLLKRVIEKF
jgi:glycosyltransferase involved in cell wall biosynthesis